MAILSPFACLAYIFLMDKRKFYVIKTNSKGLKKDEDVEIFVNVVSELIDRSDLDSNRIKLEGMLKNYQRNNGVDSSDSLIIKELIDDGYMFEEGTERFTSWYKLLRNIVDQSLKKFTKSPRLRLLQAYIYHEKMKNKFKSLFELMQAEDLKPNYLEEFSIFRYKLIIEEEMIEMDMRTNNEMSGMDVNQMVQFQNYYVKFMNTIEKAVTLHSEFWKELIEDNPDIKKLENLGSSITKIVEDSRKQFDVLSDLNPNHQKCLEVFGTFLKDVVNDETNGQRIIEKSEKVLRQASQRQAGEELNKFEEHSDTAIVTISGNYKQMGVITNSNNQITNLLGYSKNEIVGEKIEMTMPKIFADNHDDLLMKYFNNPNKTLNIERTVYSMNKRGYIIPCSLLAKILPNLDQGIRLVGFLRQLAGFDFEKDKYILYSPESGMIYGVTQACYTHYGIRASLTYGRCYNMSELNFDLLCPEILEESKQIALKSNNGCTVTLDTSTILANHPLQNEDDEVQEEKLVDKEEDEVKVNEQKSKRYKRYVIKAKIIEDKKWFEGKLRVNVLKIWETSKDQESEMNSEDNEAEANGLDKDRQAELVEDVQPMEAMGNESLNDMGSSQISNPENNADIKTVKDTRTMIAEKNVPRTIKNLNRIFYSFVLLMLVISALLIYFFSVSRTISNNANLAIKVSNKRHSLLSEINYFVRKLHLLGIGALGTPPNATDLNATRESIRDKSNELQQIQFQVVESIHRMNSDLNKDVSVKDITNYAQSDSSNSTEEATIISAYESTLFQYTSETFQVNNASVEDINNSFTQTTGMTDSVRNVKKAFAGIFTNGLRYLRSASIQVSKELYDNYTADLSKSYVVQTVLICCIGIFLVLVGTFLLIPTVFKVMKTTKLVLALFRKISPDDIRALSKKCEVFSERMLNEGDKVKALSAETPDEIRDDREKELLLREDKDKILDNSNINVNIPAKNAEEDLAFDTKTEKPQLQPNPAITVEVDKKSLRVSQMDNQDNFYGENPEERAALTMKEKEKQSKINQSSRAVNRSRERSRNKDDEGKGEDDDEEINNGLNTSKERLSQKTIALFIIFAVLLAAPLIALIIWQAVEVKQQQLLFKHLQSLAIMPAMIKYSFVFSLDSLANISLLKLIPENPQENGAEYYNKVSYDAFTDASQLLESSVSGNFDAYSELYKTVIYKNTCQAVPALNNSECANNNFMSTGVYTSATQILTKSNEVFQKVLNMEAENSGKTQVEKLAVTKDIFTQLLGAGSSIQYLMVSNGVALDFLIQSFYERMGKYIDTTLVLNLLIVIIGDIVLILVCFFVWRPYVKNLNNNIWRTKGMLSMIPMEVILKNKNLRTSMLSGDLMRAVK